MEYGSTSCCNAEIALKVCASITLIGSIFGFVGSVLAAGLPFWLFATENTIGAVTSLVALVACCTKSASLILPYVISKFFTITVVGIEIVYVVAGNEAYAKALNESADLVNFPMNLIPIMALIGISGQISFNICAVAIALRCRLLYLKLNEMQNDSINTSLNVPPNTNVVYVPTKGNILGYVAYEPKVLSSRSQS